MKPAKIHVRSICPPADGKGMYEEAVILHTGEEIRILGPRWNSELDGSEAFVKDIEFPDEAEEMLYKKFDVSEEEKKDRRKTLAKIKFAIAGAITDFCREIKDGETDRRKDRIYFKDYTPERELEVNGGKSLRIPLDGTEVYPDEYETPDEYCARFDTWDDMFEDMKRKNDKDIEEIKELLNEIAEMKKRIQEKEKSGEADREKVRFEELNKENGAGTTCKSEEAKNPAEAKKSAEL